MKAPKVSVIIPAYNAEKYLQECLDSVANQTLKDIEIICINDGSTDSSLDIMREYKKKDKRITIINQKNKGLGGARNTGMEKAKGEYIGFVDADDTISPSMYEELYEVAKKEDAEIAMCNIRLVGSSSKKKWFKPYTGKMTPEFLNKNTQPWNKITSKKLIDRTDFQFFKENGDGMFIILMLQANDIVTINDELYYYRVGHSSMSTSYKMHNFDISVESAKEQQEQLKNTPYAQVMKEYFNYRLIYSLIQALTVSALLKERDSFIEYRQELKANNYKKNKYCRIFMLPELGKVKYFASIYILPVNYHASRFLTSLILR